VQSGQSVSGVTGYTITLTAYNDYGDANPVEVKIWNIPGMTTRKGWNDEPDIPLIEIPNDVEMAKIGSTGAGGDYPLSGSYVLTGDFALTGQWNPVGNFSAPFTGKLYGNGHAITAGSGFTFANSSDTGIFGYAQDAEIRDLTVRYNTGAAAGANATSTGGITGQAGITAGKTCVIRNVIVWGASGTALTMNVSNSTTSAILSLGGIAGSMKSGVLIENSLAALNLSLTQNGTRAAACAGGGIAGYIDDTVITPGTPILSNIKAQGNITLITTTNSPKYGGGAVGWCRSNGGKLERVNWGGGTLSMSGTGNGAYIKGGGIAGQIEYPRMEYCETAADAKIAVPAADTVAYDIRIGGLAGQLGVPDAAGQPGIIVNSTARASIDVRSGKGQCRIGGLAGDINGKGDGAERIKLEYCSYEQGVIFVKPRSGVNENYIGGITGQASNWAELSECYSRAAKIEADVVTGTLYFGGFAGTFNNTKIQDCGSSSPIMMSDTGQPASTVYIGGFVGTFNYYDNSGTSAELTRCWSDGSVVSRGSGLLFTGGLIGFSVGNSAYPNKITQCYAAGIISAVSSSINGFNFHTGGLVGSTSNTQIDECYTLGHVTARRDQPDQNICVGGLTGSLDSSAIKNCYTMGNIMADNPYSNNCLVYTGGITGIIEANSSVSYTFARGSVTAKSAGTAGVYAGGIAGYNENAEITNNAALGSTATAIGPSCDARRIYSGSSGNCSDNYGADTFKLYEGSSYYTGSVEVSIESDNNDGTGQNLDVSQVDANKNFWQTTIGFNSGDAAGKWNFDAINLFQNYPLLAWE
jgi:hypothetical protein